MDQETHARITTNITDTHSFITDTLSLILVLRRLLRATAQSLPREIRAALYAVATTAALTAMHTAGGSGRDAGSLTGAVAVAAAAILPPSHRSSHSRPPPALAS